MSYPVFNVGNLESTKVSENTYQNTPAASVDSNVFRSERIQVKRKALVNLTPNAKTVIIDNLEL